jgi:NADH:ubiquinone oxidoreductase subunit F (NADH-binding)
MTHTQPRVTTPVPSAGDPYRLLAGWARTARPANLDTHRARYGPPPLGAHHGAAGRLRLIEAVETAGLRGRGGAGFPTGRKLRTVAAAGRVPVVLANGCEGEPASDKDHALLSVAPHLVLDGAVLAAHAVRATEVILCVHRDDELLDALATVLRERPAGEPGVRLVGVPARYVSSEESALVHFVNSGDARPTSKPPRPFERGVGGRPTLVDNVETLAHLALIARYGPAWFRGCGTDDSPGTALFTVSGAVTRPGVYEAGMGAHLGHVLHLAGGPRGPVRAVLVGGYGGTWLPLPRATDLRLTHADMRAVGASLGVGSLVVLPSTACGIAETAEVLRYLAGESAAQCGPCMFGLPAIAEDFERLAVGARDSADALARLHRRLGVITGRGACAHPDGAVRFAASALRTFDQDLCAHVSGHPCPWAGRTSLPLPAWENRSGGWQ